jgi:hypothetical protein
MSDPFYSAKGRIARAEAHISNLKGMVKPFLAEKPFGHVIESDTDGFLQFHKIKLTKPFPEGLANVAADAIENLRSALDNAGYAIALVAGIYKITGSTEPKSSYFPFADAPSELNNVIKGRCRDLPEDIVALMRSFQPYKGGNDLLWSLNKLCVANKHRLLVPIGILLGPWRGPVTCVGADRDEHPVFGPEGPEWPSLILPPRWDHEKHEGVFAILGPNARIEYDIHIGASVAFADIGTVGGKPAVAVLKQLLGEVAGVLNALETESRRLRLVP